MLAGSHGRWMAGCCVVAFGLLGAVAAQPAFAQTKPVPCDSLPEGEQAYARRIHKCYDPPAKSAVKGAADAKAAYTPPAKAPPTNEAAADIDRLRSQANDLAGRLRDADRRASDAEKRASEAEKRANDATKYAGEVGKRVSDAGKRASDAERHASDADNRANGAESRAQEAGKRADDAESKAAIAAQAAVDANEQVDKQRKELEETRNAQTGTQKALDEARADVQKHVASESTLNVRIETLNSRLSALESVEQKERKGLLLLPAVALLFGGVLGFLLARVFPKPRPRISVPPGATVRAHVVLNLAQSETRIEGASPTGPHVRLAATLGPGDTQLNFPQGASR